MAQKKKGFKKILITLGTLSTLGIYAPLRGTSNFKL
jgi:hypothetical protein